MKKFIISLLCITTIFTLTGCGKSNTKEDNKISKKENTENVFLKDQKVNDLTFEHFAIVKDNAEVSVLYFDITNNTEKSIDVKTVKFTLYTEGAEILSITEDINETIAPGESKAVTENFDVDLKNVDKVEYVVE